MTWTTKVRQIAFGVYVAIRNSGDAYVEIENISIVYRWGGIETVIWRRHWRNRSAISIVYRWGGIETSFSCCCCWCSVPFLLSTAEAVLRLPIVYIRKINKISIVYRWGGIETDNSVSVRSGSQIHFYCLPLRRYWDSPTRQSLARFPDFYCLPLRRYWDTICQGYCRHRPYFYCLPLRRYWDPAIFFIY